MEQYRHAYPDALLFAVVNELHPLGQTRCPLGTRIPFAPMLRRQRA